MIFAVGQRGEPMSNLIDRQKLIDVSTGLVLYADLDGKTKSYFDGLTEVYNLICQLPSAQPDFDTVEKIDLERRTDE